MTEEQKMSPQEVEALYGRLVSGTRDFMDANGFSRLILGLSGGIDSAVVCCLAASAAGAVGDAQKVLDKVAVKGVIHKNKAARLKSRLARRLNALKAQAPESEAQEG